MDHIAPPEAAPLCSCHPEGLVLEVQSEMFQREGPAPLLVTLNLSLVDDGYALGASITTLDTLELRALSAHHDLDGQPTPEALLGALVKLLEAADALRSPFPL